LGLPGALRAGRTSDGLSSNDQRRSDEERAELDRRLFEDEADPDPAEDWAVLREKLLRAEF
jgi:hypothetical protein